MNQQEFSEGSDSSDEDYIPDSKVEDAVSEEESDGDPEDHMSGSDTENKRRGKKRSKKIKKTTKKKKTSEPSTDIVDTQTSSNTSIPEENKKKADDLWDDFIKDTGFKSKSDKTNLNSNKMQKENSSAIGTKACKTESKVSSSGGSTSASSTVKITQVFEFAGEEVTVEKEVSSTSVEARLLSKGTAKVPAKKSGGLGGIGSVLSQLGKKQKISTLEKSKLDWERFKKEENIGEEIETHNKGKDGYLERQDFLQRADLRRFEIEKEVRNVERAKRFNSSV